jgi:peptidyl-prolyl cis-trans isomerase A (cyclophilin A)
MDVVDALYAGYGEGAPRGRGPDQSRIQTRGNAYLSAEFPQLDHIETAVVIG